MFSNQLHLKKRLEMKYQNKWEELLLLIIENVILDQSKNVILIDRNIDNWIEYYFKFYKQWNLKDI